MARPSSTAVINQTFTIPLPAGGEVTVTAEPSSVMSPELAKQFPDLHTWRVRGVMDPAIQGRVDFSSSGFNAMLVMPDGDTVFVSPDSKADDSNRYLSFSKNNNTESFNTNFQCGVHPNQNQKNSSTNLLAKTAARPASSLITYRLAVATTGEYTQFHGGTKQSALNAIVTTINRVNEIYERDLGITFQLVAEQLDIIYTNPLTDPYTNADGNALVNENVSNLRSDRALSQNKFDIGHVFSTGAGGLAVFEAACNNVAKAGAATGIANPINDAFNIDFVAHELGHQLGADHTFNSTSGNCGGGTRVPNSAVEPGSGSTIMAYAGICNEVDGQGNVLRNNVQENSDAAFHSLSISQILRYTRNSAEEGSTCGIRTAVSNEEPVPNAGPDNIIPANTPFVLSGTGSDPDSGDSLTYSWEQNDRGTASDLNIDTGNNAIIRSFLPKTSATRFVPVLSDLFEGLRLRAEKLPETDRALNFVLTVRDGRGGFDFDNLRLSVVDTGRSFQVTSHTVSTDLVAGQETQVNWDVAGTDIAPISCSTVDIGLIQSNGTHIDVVQRTSNDGAEGVFIPNSAIGMNRARFIVSCSDSDTTFFNISSQDLNIVATDTSSSSGGGSSSGGSTTSGGSSGGGLFDSYLILLLLSLLLFRFRMMSTFLRQKKDCAL